MNKVYSLGEIIMVNRFTDKWTKKESEPSIASKIKNVAKPQLDLKEQISQVTQRLDAQTRALDAAVHRFELRDGEIFQRVVTAMTQRDTARANILATELGGDTQGRKNAVSCLAWITECFYEIKYCFRNG